MALKDTRRDITNNTVGGALGLAAAAKMSLICF